MVLAVIANSVIIKKQPNYKNKNIESYLLSLIEKLKSHEWNMWHL